MRSLCASCLDPVSLANSSKSYWGCKLTRSASSLPPMLALPPSRKGANSTSRPRRLLLKSKRLMTKWLAQYKRFRDSLAQLQHSLESFFKAQAELKRLLKEDQKRQSQKPSLWRKRMLTKPKSWPTSSVSSPSSSNSKSSWRHI